MDVRQVSRCVLLLLWVGVSAARAEWVQNGQFPVPGIPRDVQLASGRLYVSNTTADRIEVFTPEGELLFNWGGSGSEPGQFNVPLGIAVYADTLYIVDGGNCRVQKFGLDGALSGVWTRCNPSLPGHMSFARNIVARHDHVYVTSLGHGLIYKFDLDGNFVSQYGPYSHMAAAVAGDETVWGVSATAEGPFATHYSAEGDVLARWSLIPPGADWATPIDVDLDDDGNLYITMDSLGTVEVFAPDGEHLETVVVCETRGIDVVSDHEFYVAGYSNICRYVRQQVAVEPASWGAIKGSYLDGLSAVDER